MISHNLCTGCGACISICPKDCIHFEYNETGEKTPVINKSVCIGCGICEKICPQNNHVRTNNPYKCYVAWSRKEGDIITSASGGVAAVFSRCQFAKGGKVYGCDYDNQMELRHFCIENIEDIEKIKGSKYSQSETYTSFKMIKQQLDSDDRVLFIGTPCQVAALKSFLIQDYNNLVTVDLVCHGTPPNHFLKEYLVHKGIKSNVKIRFRGEYDQILTIWKNNRIIYQKSKDKDLYYDAFYQNMISMNACYSCIYANEKRVSDITIGDFWGLGSLKRIDMLSSRPSLVLINTVRGENFFENIIGEFVVEERNVEEGINGNGRLLRPPGKNGRAITFQKYYPKFGFVNAVRIASIKFKIIENRCTYKFVLMVCKIKSFLVRKVK